MKGRVFGALLLLAMLGSTAVVVARIVNPPLPSRAFELVDAKTGRAFTEQTLRGHPAALFFGFTHCPDVCPTALSTTGRWLKALGDDAGRIRFVFVTLDPERDTPEVMARYLRSFDPRIVGLTGTRAHTDEMLERYNIYAQKRPGTAEDYFFDHTALIQLIDRDGALVDTLDFEDPVEFALAKLQKLIGIPASTRPNASPVGLNVYDDRVEMINPGGLLNPGYWRARDLSDDTLATPITTWLAK